MNPMDASMDGWMEDSEKRKNRRNRHKQWNERMKKKSIFCLGGLRREGRLSVLSVRHITDLSLYVCIHVC
jgi:hypothetical protein